MEQRRPPLPAQNEQLKQESFNNNNNELKLKQSTSCTIGWAEIALSQRSRLK